MDPAAFMLTNEDRTYAKEAYDTLVRELPSLDPEEGVAQGIAQTYGVVVRESEPTPYSDAENVALDRLEKMRPGECEAVAYFWDSAPRNGFSVRTTGWLLYGVPNPELRPAGAPPPSTGQDTPPWPSAHPAPESPRQPQRQEPGTQRRPGQYPQMGR